MTVQTINIGNVVNDGLGDDLRTAFQKVNANFSSLAAELTITGSNVGTSGVGIYKDKVGSVLEFKKLVAGTKIDLTDATNGIEINNTAPDAFTRFDTDSGSMLASLHEQITLAGTISSGAITGRKDIEVTTSGSNVYFKNTIPVVDILTIYDFGPITGSFTNVAQMAMAASNIDFGGIGSVSGPEGRIDLDCGGIL